ncbi:P-type conjugative transfer protein TrbG [Tardibacter chloracetimidivorans]|uniref:P-type conjugative transfer protein TrbG n=1 Tax=Tardibacter chloracetimidivorans TaxID=1921510 RepID=A0A1L3ZSI9_9SPHN|nr:P-type conjugative transfer protein TrbG [Tardibacter chloracetimidivorans]API58601.1 P-type conjugative transfer protein TrbG [Tardibacter chloracetimidivorans]
MIRPILLSASLFALAPLTLAPAAAQTREAASPTARVTAANRAALREPSSAGYIHAVQVYPYSEGVLYRLYAAPERVTDIALQPGETVTSVAAGDTVRWTVGDTTSGSGETRRTHILVKPFSAGLRTNLFITTDRRAYHLALESTATTAMAALSWTYPQDELIALRRTQAAAEAAAPIASGLAVESLNFNYAVSGDKPAWRPLRAFDDGRQTFIEFPASIAVGEAPPLFVTGDNGEAQLVNYRVAGRYYVVDRLFGAAELRLGEKRQKIVRITRGDPARTSRRRAS